MRWLWQYIYRFRRSNDCRANTFLGLVTIGLLFNLVVFGITPESPELSSTAQNIYSAAGIETQTSWGIWDWLRWNNWRIWWICLGLALLYRTIAWRDEFHRAWQAARHRITEVRAGLVDLTPGQPAPGGVAAQGGRGEYSVGSGAWLRIFIREFLAAILGDVLTERRR